MTPASNNGTEDSGNAPEHKFWSKQPVIQPGDPDPGDDKPIKEPEEVVIRPETYSLPTGFEWCDVDLDNADELQELYTLLARNYVEDHGSSLRFDYTPETICWFLKAPGWQKDWHVGVRATQSRKLLAFIGASPVSLLVHARPVRAVEINFLCVIRKLRSKRLAPVLIKEITRRCNKVGIHQALYTAGCELPGVISSATYYHRPLNWTKLVHVGFSRMKGTYDQMERRLRLPAEPQLAGIRPMRDEDVPQVREKLVEYMKNFNLTPDFGGEEEVRHHFLPRDGVVESFVVQDATTNEITHFVSFYTVASRILQANAYQVLKTAYLFYYYYPRTDNGYENKRRITALLQDALVFAKRGDHDVFNCLELMENAMFLDELKFAMGDGCLKYYLFNWRCNLIPNSKLGIVLV